MPEIPTFTEKQVSNLDNIEKAIGGAAHLSVEKVSKKDYLVVKQIIGRDIEVRKYEINIATDKLPESEPQSPETYFERCV